MGGFEINIHSIIDVVKRRWLIGAVIFILVGMVFTFRMMGQQNIYQADCKLEFTSSTPEGSLDSRNLWRYSSFILQNLFLTSQQIIMKSDPVLERVVRSLSLADANATPEEMERAKQGVSGSTSVERVPDSQIAIVRARSSDPEQAAKMANSLADAYIRYSYEKKINNYKRSIAWLDEELATLKAKLEQSQRDLIDFIEKEKITSFGDETGKGDENNYVESDFSEMEAMLQKLHGRKVEEEMKLHRLEQKYLPAHPEYQSVENEINLLEKKIQEEERRLAGLRRQREANIIKAKKNEIEYSILKREVEVNKEIYNALVRKHKETDIGSAIAQTDANIIQYAKIPAAPIYPNRRVQGALIWLVALIFGLGYCAVAELMDNSLKGPSDVERHFQFPLLAVVGKEKEAEVAVVPSILRDHDIMLGEAFRVLRTNLNFSLPISGASRVIMVGSTEKGEGKTTVSLNLAIVTAEIGRKTIVIDGDLRARKLSKFFGYEDALGLTNVLAGEVELDDVIKETSVAGLWLLPSGPVPPQPATLLHSEAMELSLNILRSRYQEVIVDAPPLAVVIDGNIIASMVDGVVLVIEAGSISRFEIRRCLQALEKASAKISGLVLNKFDKASKRYKYGRYYGYYGDKVKDAQEPQLKAVEAEISSDETTSKMKVSS